MVDEKIDLQGCPREGCDDPILEAFRTDSPFRLRRQNMVVDQWCIVPRVDPSTEGQFWVYCIRHGEIEDFQTARQVADAEADAPAEAVEDASGASEDPNDDAPEEYDAAAIDVSDLPEFEKAIVLHVKREETAKRAGIQGAMLGWDKSPDEVTAAVQWLAENGYLYEVTDAVYKVTEG